MQEALPSHIQRRGSRGTQAARGAGPVEAEFLQPRLRMASEGNRLPSRQAISSLTHQQIAAIGQQWLAMMAVVTNPAIRAC